MHYHIAYKFSSMINRVLSILMITIKPFAQTNLVALNLAISLNFL